jgi:hypothetical protein
MRFHQITVQILDNEAALVQVGCKSLGFPSYREALIEMTRYYQNPAAVQREYEQRYGWPSSADSPAQQQTIVGYRQPPIMGGSIQPIQPGPVGSFVGGGEYPAPPAPYPVPPEPQSEGAL